jgi:glycolate dehydrogenase FAD-binding subunit
VESTSKPIIVIDSAEYPLERLASVEELRHCVRTAGLRQTALYPVGGGTMLDLGYVPTQPGTAADLRFLDQVIDYPARDMTITVQAGITIDRLQQILRAERQQLPVDIPSPERATLGGAIATNASGPRRYGLGTLRDYVIGISVVNDRGEEIKAGGRVVKNVAGYDLMKLYTGSLGTLGIITQVTLKLRPLPEAAALLVIPVDASRLAESLSLLHATRTRPVCIELLSPAACDAIEQAHSLGALRRGSSQWSIVVGFEDNKKAVAWQVEQLGRELAVQLAEYTESVRERLMAALRDFPLSPDAALSFKANMVPSAVADFCARALESSSAPLLQAHAGNGIVIGHIRDLSLEQAKSMIERLSALAAAANGNLIVTRCPADWKAVLPIWGRSTGDRVLMKAVKAKLDPDHIFNPGRYVDGI